MMWGKRKRIVSLSRDRVRQKNAPGLKERALEPAVYIEKTQNSIGGVGARPARGGKGPVLKKREGRPAAFPFGGAGNGEARLFAEDTGSCLLGWL